MDYPIDPHYSEWRFIQNFHYISTLVTDKVINHALCFAQTSHKISTSKVSVFCSSEFCFHFYFEKQKAALEFKLFFNQCQYQEETFVVREWKTGEIYWGRDNVFLSFTEALEFFQSLVKEYFQIKE